MDMIDEPESPPLNISTDASEAESDMDDEDGNEDALFGGGDDISGKSMDEDGFSHV